MVCERRPGFYHMRHDLMFYGYGCLKIHFHTIIRYKKEQHQHLGLCCSNTMPSETAKRLNVEALLLLEFEAVRNSQFLQFLVLSYYPTTSKPHFLCPAQNYCLPSSLFYTSCNQATHTVNILGRSNLLPPRV